LRLGDGILLKSCCCCCCCCVIGGGVVIVIVSKCSSLGEFGFEADSFTRGVEESKNSEETVVGEEGEVRGDIKVSACVVKCTCAALDEEEVGEACNVVLLDASESLLLILIVVNCCCCCCCCCSVVVLVNSVSSVSVGAVVLLLLLLLLLVLLLLLELQILTSTFLLFELLLNLLCTYSSEITNAATTSTGIVVAIASVLSSV